MSIVKVITNRIQNRKALIDRNMAMVIDNQHTNTTRIYISLSNLQKKCIINYVNRCVTLTLNKSRFIFNQCV